MSAQVRDWQQGVLAKARAEGYTRTLMGRYRELPEITSKSSLYRGHAERAAINTPIQGGAADVVMMAMLKASRNQRLKELGWKMLLQIHDEVRVCVVLRVVCTVWVVVEPNFGGFAGTQLIFEGPLESKDEALALVVRYHSCVSFAVIQ